MQSRVLQSLYTSMDASKRLPSGESAKLVMSSGEAVTGSGVACPSANRQTCELAACAARPSGRFESTYNERPSGDQRGLV